MAQQYQRFEKFGIWADCVPEKQIRSTKQGCTALIEDALKGLFFCGISQGCENFNRMLSHVLRHSAPFLSPKHEISILHVLRTLHAMAG